MSDMIGGLINSFGGPVLEELGTKLGLPPAVVKQAIPIVIGLVVAAVARKGRTPEGVQELGGLIDSANEQVGGASLTDFIKNADPSRSSDLLKGLTGGNSVENVMGNISRTTGVPVETITAAFGTVAPAVISQISGMAKEKGLDTAGLVELIGQQGDAVKALGNMDYLLDDVPGIGDDISRGFKKIFGG
jgi:hypothetical protein